MKASWFYFLLLVYFRFCLFWLLFILLSVCFGLGLIMLLFALSFIVLMFFNVYFLLSPPGRMLLSFDKFLALHLYRLSPIAIPFMSVPYGDGKPGFFFLPRFFPVFFTLFTTKENGKTEEKNPENWKSVSRCASFPNAQWQSTLSGDAEALANLIAFTNDAKKLWLCCRVAKARIETTLATPSPMAMLIKFDGNGCFLKSVLENGLT